MKKNQRKTQEKEHYLKEIFKLLEINKEVTVTSLSKNLNLSKSSVSNMIKKLVEMGFIDTKPYKPIVLTPEGQNYSESIVAKHRLIESFLVEIMDFNPDEVHEIAEEIEHIDSPIFFNRVKKMLKHNKVDPHGSQIPDVKFLKKSLP